MPLPVPAITLVPAQATPRQQVPVTGTHFERVTGVFLYDAVSHDFMPVAGFQVTDGFHLRFTVRWDTPAGNYTVVLVDLENVDSSLTNPLAQIAIVSVITPYIPPVVDPTIPADVVTMVRMELQDNPRSFQTTATGNGVDVRFELDQHPIDAASLLVGVIEEGTQTLVPLVLGADYTVTERDGIVTLTQPLDDLDTLVITGTSFRYFTTAELGYFINTAFLQQTHQRSVVSHVIDPVTGFKTYDVAAYSYATLEPVEKQPLAIAAAIQALWVLATDASTDIDIGVEGVSIPRSERYRQIMQQIGALQARYMMLTEQLNIGLGAIEMFDLRRVSRQTGRLVPLYVEKEYDDHSAPIRKYPPINHGVNADQEGADPYYTVIGP